MSPHPGAPLFEESDRTELTRQILQEVRGGNLQTANQEVRRVLRELSLVSLWFALKYVAGFSGPFSELDEDVDVDSCNFYQRHERREGARCAVFMPRGFYKSTVFTTGSTWWDLVRNPSLKICIGNAKESNSEEFMGVIARTFDSNELFQWLFPEYAVNYNALARWSTKEMVVPTRRRYAKEPSVACIGVGGASEGNHYNRLKLDDLVGLKSLNADRRSNAEMYKTLNWMLANQRTLLHSVRRDQVWVIGTRYGIDDVYKSVADSLAEVEGYVGRYEISEDNPVWTLYNREVIEDGRAIKPEIMDQDSFEQLLKDDWWTGVTQYRNAPEESGLNELYDYAVGESEMEYDRHLGWSISYWAGGEEKRFLLSECDVGTGGDPAASEKYVNARTSKSAVVVWLQDPLGNYHLIEERAGYVGTNEFMGWLFACKGKFRGAHRLTVLEQNGPFKMLGGQLRDLERQKGVPLNLVSVVAIGDKDARIRTVFEPLLAQKRVFCVKGVGLEFRSEVGSFPQGRTKDTMDASSHVIPKLVRPERQEDRERRKRRRQIRRAVVNMKTGY